MLRSAGTDAALLLMRIALALVLSSCGPSATVLLVHIRDIPLGTARLDSFSFLNAVLANEQPEIQIPADRDTYSFVLQLPAVGNGLIVQEVAARDAQGCLLAMGDGQVTVRQAELGSNLALEISLQSLVSTACQTRLPILIQATPDRVSTAGGDEITIEGVGFQPSAVVTIGETSIATTWISHRQRRVVTPPRRGKAGAVVVAVVNPGGSEDRRTNLLTYFYGAPAFELQHHFMSVGDYTGHLAVADLNGDGWSDLVFSRQEAGTGRNWLVIWINQQDGSFSTFSYGPVRILSAIALADFNADGQTDIAISTTEKDVPLFFNQGNGVFSGTPTLLQTGLNLVYTLIAADFDRDGMPDLAITGGPVDQQYVAILKNTGSGHFTMMKTISVASRALDSLKARDFNGDGWLDLGGYYPVPFNEVRVNLNVQGVLSDETTVVTVPFSGEGLAGDLDLNADGRLDLVLKSRASQVAVLLSSKSGDIGFASPLSYGVTDPYLPVSVGDVNADGFPDIIDGAASSFGIRFNGGKGNFGVRHNVTMSQANGENYGITVIPDINNDGLQDLFGFPIDGVDIYINRIQ